MNGPGVPHAGSDLRIVELTQRFPPAIGGVERHVKDLATNLHRTGASVEVITSDLYRDRPFTRLFTASEPLPFPVRRHRAFRGFPAPHGLGIAAPGMAWDALRLTHAIVHAHAFGFFPTWAGRLAQQLRGLPLVITPHFDGGSGSRLYARAVARGTLAGADRVVALTQSEAISLATLGVDRERIRVIPNGIGTEDFLPRRGPRPDAGPVTILYVGRIDPEQKGLDDLLRAVALLERPEAVSVRLVGEDWGGATALRSLATGLGIDHVIIWTGAVPQDSLRREYASADLFVLPSHFEPFGIVLLEAMAAGLPVLATRVGGIPEVVADGVTGSLVPSGDPSALAHALDRLASDPLLRTRLGDCGRTRALDFSWPRLIPKFLELFHELVRDASGSRL
ncbi:MAG TPA: glycosyltransferase family 4 protein [Thermoplasmata archaeon]|nr:glycosyltransferase family 4 protein [Thermoplasmata archaeon]